MRRDEKIPMAIHSAIAIPMDWKNSRILLLPLRKRRGKLSKFCSFARPGEQDFP